MEDLDKYKIKRGKKKVFMNSLNCRISIPKKSFPFLILSAY